MFESNHPPFEQEFPNPRFIQIAVVHPRNMVGGDVSVEVWKSPNPLYERWLLGALILLIVPTHTLSF